MRSSGSEPCAAYSKRLSDDGEIDKSICFRLRQSTNGSNAALFHVSIDEDAQSTPCPAPPP